MLYEQKKKHKSQLSYKQKSIYLGGSKLLLPSERDQGIWGREMGTKKASRSEAEEEEAWVAGTDLYWPMRADGTSLASPMLSGSISLGERGVKLTMLGVFTEFRNQQILQIGAFLIPESGSVNIYLHACWKEGRRDPELSAPQKGQHSTRRTARCWAEVGFYWAYYWVLGPPALQSLLPLRSVVLTLHTGILWGVIKILMPGPHSLDSVLIGLDTGIFQSFPDDYTMHTNFALGVRRKELSKLWVGDSIGYASTRHRVKSNYTFN